ncbi:MAG: hypothetical protein HYU80_02360 [Candidatus Blackburnbacteria bacterium]|nr:hypothetical protein [Candidatus Blackburnbacteria bacterium]
MTKLKTHIRGKLWILLFIPLVGSVILQLVIVNAVAGDGKELSKIERQIEKTRKENNILREETAHARSLREISKIGAELGLLKPTSIVYIDLSAGQARKAIQVGVLPNAGELGQ